MACSPPLWLTKLLEATPQTIAKKNTMKKQPTSPLLTTGLPVIVVVVALHLIFYTTQPLPAPWTDIFVDMFTILSAALGAFIATLLSSQFKKSEPPRAVWINFSLGLWSFAFARTIVMIYFLIYGNNFPVANWSDLFYFSGILFFSISLILQFRLILEPSKKQELRNLTWIGGAVLLGSLIVTVVLQQLTASIDWFTAFRQAFFLSCGIAILAASIRLSRLFGRGAWGRAWWGVLIFVLAHFTFMILTAVGSYSRAVEPGNMLSLLADSLYLIAYLINALMSYAQYLLVRFGHTLRARPEPDSSAPAIQA